MVRALCSESTGGASTLCRSEVERRIGDWLVCYLDDKEPSRLTASFGGMLDSGALLMPLAQPRRRATSTGRNSPRTRHWTRIDVRRSKTVLVAKVLDQLLIKENVIEELAEDLDDVLRAGYRRIVLNFAQVERMSSQIVGVVVKAHRRCIEAPGGMLKVCGLRREIADAFALAGLREALSIHPDEAASLESPWPERPGPRALPLSILAALTAGNPSSRPPDEPVAASSFDAPEVEMGRDPVDEQARSFLWLVVEAGPETGPGKGSVVAVRGDFFLIGRGAECHLPLPGPHLGWRHAAVERVGDRVMLRDLGSGAGTFVNGRALHQAAAPLRHGDKIRVGPLILSVALGTARGDHAGIEDLVASWLAEGGEPLPLPSPAGDEEKERSEVDSIPVNEVAEAAPESRLKFEVIQDVLVVTPRIDRLDEEAAVEQFRLGLSELFELPLPRKVALRLDHVSHISSRGIGILLAYFLRLERAGGALRLCELHSRVLSVLEQFRLTVLLEVCSTVEEAVITAWD